MASDSGIKPKASASAWMASSVGTTMINSMQAGYDAPSNTEPLPLRDSRRFRNGSLPLKKRRLYDANPLWELHVNNEMPTGTVSAPSSSFLSGRASENPGAATTNTFDGKSFTNSEEKIAVLALVAAAATAGHDTEAPDDTINFSAATSDKSLKEDVVVTKAHLTKRGNSVSPVDQNHTKTISTEKEGIVRPNGRIHHPPLSTPLPNGCHGRTSRNNSYCRRQPCYNGSKYCKLHYQHYVIAGIRPWDEADATSTCIPIEGSNRAATPTAPQVVTIAQQQQQQPLQQDKRFTGCDDEIRCEATTTRGRACAYVAVQGTKYCYLHADYDTNPPPRRGGVLNSNPTGKPKLLLNGSAAPKRVSIVGTDRLAALPSTADMAPSYDKPSHSSSPPSVSSEESCSSSMSHQVVSDETSENPNKTKIAESPYPLLSSISPDQWHGKRVRVATGPLVGRTGIVEKWGNGWVGVRVSIGTEGMADPHLHNRRALELYLLPDQGDTFINTGHDADSQFETQDAILRRCVSREADVVESKDSMENAREDEEEGRYPLKDTRSETATPSIPSDMESDNQDTKYEVETANGMRGTMIPESPLTPAHGLNTVDFSVSSCHFIPRSDEVHSDVYGYVAGNSAATVTPKPSSPRKIRVDEELPLVQSLMMAQEGFKRKSHLDLLFGTAALERSRRQVHKPQRYEDKAMLIRKRGREGETDSPTKRCPP